MRKLLLVGLAVLGQACGGGDDKPAAMKGTVNATQARTTVTNAVSLRTAVDSMNGANVAGSALAFNASTAGIVAPGAPAGKALTVANLETIMQAQTSASQMCTATGCKFVNHAVGATTLNGNLDVVASGEGKKITWDLTMKGTAPAGVPALGFDYQGKGDITISATSLVGEVTTKSSAAGTQGGQSFSGGSESYVKFESVVLAAGAPTAGSLYARVTSTGSSGGQSASQSYEGTHAFAPK